MDNPKINKNIAFTYARSTKPQSKDEDVILMSKEIPTDDTQETTPQQQNQKQQQATQATRQQNTLNRIDDARKLFGELTNEQFQDKDKDLKQINNYDVLTKDFKKILFNKSKAKSNYYVDDDRAAWLERFIIASKNFLTSKDVANKRKHEFEEQEEGRKKNRDVNTHGQDDLNVNNNQTPQHWVKAPSLTPEYPLLINKLSEPQQDIKKYIEKIIFENPTELGKINSIISARTGIKIICETQSARDHTKANLQKIAPEIEVKTLNFENPKIRVNDVNLPFSIPDDKQELEIIKQKIQENINIANEIKDKSQLKVLHVYKQGKTDKCGVLIQITPYLRSLFQKKNGKIFIGTGLHEFTDQFDYKICQKCKRLGHTANGCRSTMRCEFCARPQHGKCEIENNISEWYCPNCGKQGHKFTSLKCQVFTRTLIGAMRKVNYPYEWLIQASKQRQKDFME